MPKADHKAGQGTHVTMLVDAESGRVIRCQSCDFQLTFMQAIVGGVDPVERWQRYVCRQCGTAFNYRTRTRRLTRAG